METFLSVTVAAIVTASLLWILLRKGHKNQRGKLPPPVAGGAWPVIGHLHLLAGGSQLPHKTLGSLADKYGPIFMIKLGLDDTLVVSDSKTAKECLTSNDRAFASRPKSLAAELMGFNSAMFGLSPYGSYWREIRKTVMLELLSGRRIEMFRHVRESEVRDSVKNVYRRWLKMNTDNPSGSQSFPIEMKQWFGELIAHIMGKVLIGKRYYNDDEEGRRWVEVLRKFFELLGAFVVADVIPFLRWFDIGGLEKSMKEIGKEMDVMVEGWLQEHKMKKKINAGFEKKGEEEDFMDVMLSLLDNSSQIEQFPGDYDVDTIIKSTCMAVLSGGTDTTTVTLTWALSLLLNNASALRKVQDELDIHVGRARWVEESDLRNLVYLQAVVKETLRLYPAGPLSIPHESMEDCKVCGYDIHRGTRLIVNLWKIQRDPEAWENPYKFIPERFLTTNKDIDVRGHDFELIPFGSGRRMCPGMSLALQVLPLTLATLLQGFEVIKPTNDPIDMSESFGLTNLKATPLEVLLAPRLSSELYE